MTPNLPALDDPHPAYSSAIRQAVERWQAGDCVAFPTETVYGLGADARNPDAIAKIFALKQRPTTHPLIVHVADLRQVDQLGIALSGPAWQLADAFWPGPLTLIVPRPASLPASVAGGRSTVGIRLPMHPVAQQLLTAFGGPIAAPSANRFGQLSATSVEHVRASFSEQELPCVIDGGHCRLGLESTIVDVSQPGLISLLRPGNITVEQIETILDGPALSVPYSAIDPADTHLAPAPGTLSRHYCPRTPLHLIPTPQWEQALATFATDHPDMACLALSPAPPNLPPQCTYRQAPSGVSAYSRQLYDSLHQLDDQHPYVILVEAPPPLPVWEAVRDRLTRAACNRPAPA